MSSSDNNHTRLDSASSTAVILRQGKSPDDQPGDVQFCMCGCEQECRSRYIRGHNLRKDSRRKPRPDTRPDISPERGPVIQPDFDFDQPAWIDDIPGKPPVLNHDGNGTEILGPCVKITGAGYFHLTDSLVESFTSAVKFCNAVLCDENGSLILDDSGRARWHIVKLGRNSVIVHEGTISVRSTYLAFKITSARTLEPQDWSRYISIEVTNKGGFTRVCEIASMDFEQPRARARWIDALDVSASGRVNDIKIYIRCLRSMLGDDGIAIHGQGPVSHDGTKLFVSRSVVFDTGGKIRDDIRVDLSALPDDYAYYDITPPDEITEDQIKLGCEELIAAYAESSKHPEIPAAFLGQLFTAPVVAIDPRHFSALHLSGLKGSGKTYLALRYDSIQSRKLRGDLRLIKPVLNLGDTTGTAKGPKYRVMEYGGFAITTDDVIKSGDTTTRIALQSDVVSNLVRSYESGGAPLAGVDHATSTVVSRQSGALHTSLKVCTELPITGPSTRDRMIILPHLTESWGKGGIFDKRLSVRLSTPDSRELQHRAWSAYVYWLFQRMDTELAECYTQARDETRTWQTENNIEDRFGERYAALIAGHYAFARFCAEHGIDITETVRKAIAALRECASRQAESFIPPAILYRSFISQMRSEGRIAFTGRAYADDDGSQAGGFTDPRQITEKLQDDGTRIVVREMPPGTSLMSDLGLVAQGASWAPNSRATPGVCGFVIPPRDGKGARAGSERRHMCTAAIPVENFKSQCNMATEYYKTRGGHVITPDVIVKSLEQLDVGSRERVRILWNTEPEVSKKIQPSRVIEIDWSWLFASDENGE